MLDRIRCFSRALLCVSAFAGLSACGGSSFSSSIGSDVSPVTVATVTTPAAPPSFGSTPSVPGTNDVVIATPSTTTVSTVLGSSTTVSIAFTSSDGLAITGFGVLGDSAPLPAGWSVPSDFVCATVANGSSCVIDLQFAPTAVASGTLVVDYVYVSNAGQAKTGSAVSIPYSATPSNNVVGAAAPGGQINAVVGTGSRAVTLNFITDDGNPATNFQLTSDLTQLPPGWSSAQPTFSCALITTGNGCTLALRFAPLAPARGTLALSYAYTDDAGVGKTGSLNVPYASSTANTVTAVTAPGAEITAAKNGGAKAVAVTFTTDDGKPASALSVSSDLTQLPVGWSSTAATFACASVAAGSGCQLPLRFAPTTLGNGTLVLHYVYQDGSGTRRGGVLDIGYAATSSDSVEASVAPSGQINAVAADGMRPGSGVQDVAVVFSTDDQRPATNLTVTAGLTLPAGWSGPSSFACSGVDLVTPCKLQLRYAPAGAGAGTVLLNYNYQNNAGATQSGSLSIDYRATTNNNVTAAANPLTLASRTGSTTAVSIAFTTDDGNPASALTLSKLALPSGWSGPSAFSCATVTKDAGCTLTLRYAPTTAGAASTLSLPYTFKNDAGYLVPGNVTIPYSALTPYAYVTNTAANTVSACPLRADNSLGACMVTGSGFNGPAAIVLTGSYAYISNTLGASVSHCLLGAGGALSNCSTTGGFMNPTYLAVGSAGTTLYVNQNGSLTVCVIGAADGALSNCLPAGAAANPLAGVALDAAGALYSVHTDTTIPAAPSELEHCELAASGAISACSGTPAPLAIAALAIQGDDLYSSTSSGALYVCPLNPAGAGCVLTAANTQARAAAFMMTPTPTAYLSTGAQLLVCPLGADGVLGNCATAADPTFNGPAGVALRYP